MTGHVILTSAAAAQQAETLPELAELLTRAVPEEDLPNYGDLSPMVGMDLFGNLADALGRVGSDTTISSEYSLTMFTAALTKILAAQQRRIEQLTEAVDRHERAINHMDNHITAGQDVQIERLQKRVDALEAAREPKPSKGGASKK